MKARDLLRESADGLLANRARTLLTILGIVIGIAAVIAMTSLIDGMKQQIVGQLGLNSARAVNITCWPPGDRQLDMDDVEQLATELVADYDYLTGYSNTYSSEVSSSTAQINDLSITACTPKYFEAMGTKAASGRLFSQSEYDDEGKVIVLAGSTVKELFGADDADCVGQSVRIGSDQYIVVGVIANEYTFSYNLAYMPYSTAKTRIMGQGSYVDTILGFAREGSDMYSVADSTAAYLRQKYNIPETDPNEGGNSSDGYVYVYTAQETIDQLEDTMATFRLMALAVAGISLLVGGIGIMNMMLTNVTERIREIGLRKALGARRADITWQFLLESIAICIVGGVLGVAVGYGGAWALAGVVGASLGYEGMVPVITAQTAVMATGICVGIGVVFGYYPARRAARLDPVESLRYQ